MRKAGNILGGGDVSKTNFEIPKIKITLIYVRGCIMQTNSLANPS